MRDLPATSAGAVRGAVLPPDPADCWSVRQPNRCRYLPQVAIDHQSET